MVRLSGDLDGPRVAVEDSLGRPNGGPARYPPNGEYSQPLLAGESDLDVRSKYQDLLPEHESPRASPGKLAIGFTVTMLVIALGMWVYQPKLHRRGQLAVDTGYVDQSAGVGRLPFMGYNTWNAYWCNINETVVLENARLMKSLGLKDVGYEYVGVDDCYSEKQRSSAGDIVANKERFPSGMKKLTDEIHSLGLKAGIYSDSGWFTCQLYPGSYGNEERDAKLFQEEWGFDLLKYDNCAIPFDSVMKEGMVGKFTRMAKALSDLSKKTGKPQMLFSLCQWGREEPWLWARRLGHSWRTTDDINASWGSITDLLNRNSFISWASDFFGHNDMDMLEVGNGDLTYDEAKSHFTAWALMKSPLVIGTHLQGASKETLEILKNKEIIAINQDPVVGPGITPFRWGINPDWTYNWTHPAQYWSGRSENGTVFMLVSVDRSSCHPLALFLSILPAT
ncbi:hypothetical protein D9611_007253 [Ephemerocybe angulata]|uniref:Alpha-galactosidase n=1 Tax=Ephemerocybe angulata TaxID=980116 RepID=A0A8H5B1E1_9AGAR|nr:hypothetical protein D9611_007253 [Tulosesus angulatus]